MKSIGVGLRDTCKQVSWIRSSELPHSLTVVAKAMPATKLRRGKLPRQAEVSGKKAAIGCPGPNWI
jgi:hypothetical protein